MTRIANNYLERVEARSAHRALKRQIVFGLLLGWMLILVSSTKYFLTVTQHDSLWRMVLFFGFALLAMTLLSPSSLRGIESLWSKGAMTVGRTVFLLLLVIIYYLMFYPIGIAFRRLHGTTPLYSWRNQPLEHYEGWTSKETPNVMRTTKSSPLPFYFIKALSYFSKNGSYFFLPVLMVLLALGLLMFFVQTSSLAPFLYTLF